MKHSNVVIEFIENALGSPFVVREVATGELLFVMAGGKGEQPGPPPPTPEETAFTVAQTESLSQQTALLQRAEQRDLLAQQQTDAALQEQEALLPFFYEDLGLRRIEDVTPGGTFTAEQSARLNALRNTRQRAPDVKERTRADIDADLRQARIQLQGAVELEGEDTFSPFDVERAEKRIARLRKETPVVGVQDAFLPYTAAQQTEIDALLTAQQAAGTSTTSIRYERIPEGPQSESDLRQEEIQKLQEERSLAALKGKLPVGDAVVRDLARNRQIFEVGARRRLGPGWRESTAGIEGLGRQEETSLVVKDMIREGRLTNAEALALNRQQQREASQFNQTNLALNRFSATTQPRLSAAALLGTDVGRLSSLAGGFGQATDTAGRGAASLRNFRAVNRGGPGTDNTGAIIGGIGSLAIAAGIAY